MNALSISCIDHQVEKKTRCIRLCIRYICKFYRRFMNQVLSN